MGKNAERQKLREEQACIESQWVFKSPYLQVRQDTIQHLQKSPEIWTIAVLRGAVAVLPIDSQGNLILIEQWRRAANQITLEIPAGIIDAGEDPLTAAQRELQEETGFKAGKITPIGGCLTSPGTVSEYIHLFTAEDLIESPLQAEDTDKIDVRKIPFKEAVQLIEQGIICDAKTTITILRLKYA